MNRNQLISIQFRTSYLKRHFLESVTKCLFTFTGPVRKPSETCKKLVRNVRMDLCDIGDHFDGIHGGTINIISKHS